MIKRYEPEYGRSSGWDSIPKIEMCLDDSGDFVKYEDHIVELAALRVKLEEAEKDAKRYRVIRESGSVAASSIRDIGFCMTTAAMTEERKAALDAMCDAAISKEKVQL